MTKPPSARRKTVAAVMPAMPRSRSNAGEPFPLRGLG